MQSGFTVILESKKLKSVTVSIVAPSVCHEVMGPDAMILVFWTLSFKHAFSLSSFTLIKRLFAANSLQSCPTLCNPIDSSPPGTSVPGILQIRILGWVAISFSEETLYFLLIYRWVVKIANHPAIFPGYSSLAVDENLLLQLF